MNNLFKNLAYDLPASIVVFLVAVPLCLGIAIGSGAEPIAGLIAGIVGGIVVGFISNSAISVSGPAAGLISTVALILSKVPAYEAFLLVVLIAGVFQLVFGMVKGGVLVNFVPVSVIKGMLAAIGILLILKQFPHLVGYDADFEGDEAFFQKDGNNTLTEIAIALGKFTPLAVIIGCVGIAIQIFWDSKWFPFPKYRLLFPAPLVVVLAGVGCNALAMTRFPDYAIQTEHLVNLPVISGLSEAGSLLRFPDFSHLGKWVIWISAIQIAVIASIESLLSIEASDKLDSEKRVTNPNRELIAQGSGNIVAGLLGGLPITSVIVRSSVNANSGAKTKSSAIFHGIIMAVCVLFFPTILNQIPLSALASVLMYTGYKLAKPLVFKEMLSKGITVFLPFLVTILAILVTDLLVGILIGISVGLYYIIRSNFQESVKYITSENNYLFRFGTQVTFLNKSKLKTRLYQAEPGAFVHIDLSRCAFLDYDIIDILDDFNIHAKAEGIHVDYKFANPRQKRKLKALPDEITHQAASEQQVMGRGKERGES